MKEFGDKVPEGIKKDIETKVVEVRKAVEGEDIEAMKAVTDELGQLIQKIGASVYETQEFGSATAEAEAGPEFEGSGAEDDVVEGEVSE